MIDAMNTPETSIGDILRDVRCKNDPPEESQLRGGPLLEEIVKLAAMTAGYYLAKTAGASYVAPYTEVRTKADLRQLMQRACKDHRKTYAVIFCTDMLGGSPSEEDLALKTVKAYARVYGLLQGSTSWELPSVESVLLAVKQAIGERSAGGRRTH
jgi:hypothetical protein